MSLSLADLDSLFLKATGQFLRHPIATFADSLHTLRGASSTELKQAFQGVGSWAASGPLVPSPVGIPLPSRAAAVTYGALGLTAAGVGAAAVGRAGVLGIRAIRAHPGGVLGALGGSAGAIRIGKTIRSEVRASRKRTLSAKRKAEKDALRAKARAAKEEARAAKAEAKAATRGARRRTAKAPRERSSRRGSLLRRGARRSPRRAMTALQLKYFGKGHR